MKKIAVRQVFRKIVELEGLDPDRADLSAADKARRADLVNERVEQAWTEAWWPEAMLIERRQYRPTWAVGTTYALDAEVFYEDGDGNEAYYISLSAGNVGNTPSYAADTAYWAKVDDEEFLRTIDFEQSWETNEIEGVDCQACLFDRDPRIYPDTQALPDVHLYSDGDATYVLVRTSDAPTRPYLKFRPPAPEFSWTDWDSTKTYAVGDLVYIEAAAGTVYGNTYKALAASTNKNPATETAYWEKVEFPKFLLGFVKHAVRADLLEEDEGRYREEAKAAAEMERLQETRIDARTGPRRAVYLGG
jgi:hypothetical protein